MATDDDDDADDDAFDDDDGGDDSSVPRLLTNKNQCLGCSPKHSLRASTTGVLLTLLLQSLSLFHNVVRLT